MRTRLLAAPVILLALVPTIAVVTGCFLPESGTPGGNEFNLAPNVIISADVTRGIAPLTIPFSSSQSTDDGLIVARLWDFGDGTISQEIAPTHTYTQTGEYTVTLTLTDDGSPPETASDTVTIYVTQAPVPVIAVDRTTSESAPAVFMFDASGSSDPDGEIKSYQWEFGDGSTDVVATVAHTYSQPGTYRVILKVTDDTGVSNSATIMVEVGIEKPLVNFVSPPSTIRNIALPMDAPLWTYVEYDVELGVPRFLTAGIDGDVDACDALTEVYMTGSGAVLMTLDGHTDRVRDAAYSPDGTSIITAGDDGTLRLHDAISGDLIFNYTGDTTPITSVAWAPDGSQFAYGVSDGRVIRRATQTGAVLATYTNHSGAANDVIYTNDGTQLLSAGVDRRILLTNIADGLVVREFTGHDLSVTDIDISGELMASASVDGTARVWNILSGVELARFNGHQAPVYSVAFSPDGSQVLSGGSDSRAQLWNTVDGTWQRTFSGHASTVVSTAFAPDGATVATGARDAVARIWDIDTGEVIRRMQPCDSAISAVDFSPDGTQMLAAVAAANSIQLDTPEPQGNDMNLTTPQPLNLNVAGVEPGTYFLWAELDTDRTAPARTYAPTVIQVLDTLPSLVIDPNDPASTPPQVALVNNAVTVMVAPRVDRQIFDLGPLNLGDRLIISFASVPGYGDYYSEPKIAESTGLATGTTNVGSEGDGFYSLMLLDREQDVLAWYQDSGVLFSPDAKIVVGSNNSSHYLATDTATSAHIQVIRNAGLTPRQQRVYLDFEGGNSLVIAGSVPFDIPPLTTTLLNTGAYTEDQITNDIKRGIVTRVRNMLAPYNVQITCSEGSLNEPPDDGDPPASPFQRVYFGGTFFMQWDDDTEVYDLGTADYVDPRNETLTGTGAVSVDGILTVYGTSLPAAGTMGLILGNATAYDIGFLLGLRRTEGSTNDIMDLGGLWGITGPALIETSTPVFTEAALRAYEQYGTRPEPPTRAVEAIGIQDAPTLFQQLIGPAP